MAKSAFDENVPRARPRIRFGQTTEDTVTEAPPVRPHAEPVAEALAPPAPIARLAEPELPIVAPPPEPPRPARELVSPPVMVEVVEAKAEVPVAKVEVVEERVEPIAPNVELPAAIASAESVGRGLVPRRDQPQAFAAGDKPPPYAARESSPATAAVSDDQADSRRASIKRRAATLGVAPPVPAPEPLSANVLEDLDAIDSAADLASELERALAQAAESNEQLRRDLGMALDDLARTTAERKRLQESAGKLESDARDRTTVVQDLMREMELLEGERDAALTKAADSSLAIDQMSDAVALAERRVHDVERALSESQARSRRLEESSQAHTAQRSALRAEVDSLRRERDSMVARIAELEREHEDLSKSKRALDEVHRALSEARQRAQRVRAR